MIDLEYKKRLEADLNLLKRALLNFPNKEKKIKSLMKHLRRLLLCLLWINLKESSPEFVH